MKYARYLGAAALLASACAKPATTTSGPAAAPTTSPAAAQIARGQALFGRYCAGCHGNAGQGGDKAPAVVGSSALPLEPPATAKARTVKFHTALDVGQWVMKYMPAKKPGSLSADQYLAILAFDLQANGVKLAAPLTVDGARAIVLHP